MGTMTGRETATATGKVRRQEPNGPLAELAQSLAGELARLRDEMMLKIHLAEMDARDAWNQISPEVEKVEKRLEESARRAVDGVGDEAELQLHLAFMDARERWGELEGHLRGIASRVRRAGTQAIEALVSLPDRAKLHTTLARMDAEDAWAERLAELQGRLEAAEGTATEMAHKIAGEMRASARKLRGTVQEAEPKES